MESVQFRSAKERFFRGAKGDIGVLIFKLISRSDWEKTCDLPSWQGSPDDLRDGFIHFSTGEQLAGTISKHFAGVPDLLTLEFQAEELGPELRWEVSRNGQLFPHLYGPMPIGKVRRVTAVSGDRDPV